MCRLVYLPEGAAGDTRFPVIVMASGLSAPIIVESLEKIREFDPVGVIHMPGPAAPLVIAAEVLPNFSCQLGSQCPQLAQT